MGANSSAINEVNSFEELHALLEELVRNTSGIGPLYIYDTSLRIGAFLGISPQQVFLHAGTTEGAKALGLETNFGYLEVEELPSSLEQLEPHEIEDILCIFKDDIKGINKGVVEDKIIQRSRHC